MPRPLIATFVILLSSVQISLCQQGKYDLELGFVPAKVSNTANPEMTQIISGSSGIASAIEGLQFEKKEGSYLIKSYYADYTITHWYSKNKRSEIKLGLGASVNFKHRALFVSTKSELLEEKQSDKPQYERETLTLTQRVTLYDLYHSVNVLPSVQLNYHLTQRISMNGRAAVVAGFPVTNSYFVTDAKVERREYRYQDQVTVEEKTRYSASRYNKDWQMHFGFQFSGGFSLRIFHNRPVFVETGYLMGYNRYFFNQQGLQEIYFGPVIGIRSFLTYR